jgi:hypothetical protein
VRELGDGYGGNGVPVSASVSTARARGRKKRMSAREGGEGGRSGFNSRLGSRRGGSCSARSPRVAVLLPARHDTPVVELVTETEPPMTD